MEQKNKTIWAKILQVLITVLTSIATTLTTNAAVIG
ncbi:smalltalk protein [Parabacteroides distasonis]|nr:smalltalk protein [Parabacteroides distasonis]